MRNINFTLFSILLLLMATSVRAVDKIVEIEKNIQKTLNKYCADCHDSETEKGDIRLDNFVNLSDNLQSILIGHVEEQVFTENMPPKKKTQLTKTDRKNLFDFIKKWHDLKGEKSKFRSKLQMPEYYGPIQ